MSSPMIAKDSMREAADKVRQIRQVHVLLTRQSSCGKLQEAYRPRHNLSKNNLSRGGGGG